jgi:transcriptional regulator with XRE-family HTH domain
MMLRMKSDEALARIGARVRRMRQAKRLRQVDLARKLGIGLSSLIKIERGTGNPPLRLLFALVEALEVSALDLIVMLDEEPI